MAQHNAATTTLREGDRGFDYRHEFEVQEISPDGFEVTIRYTADGEQLTVQRNRFQIRDGELHLA